MPSTTMSLKRTAAPRPSGTVRQPKPLSEVQLGLPERPRAAGRAEPVVAHVRAILDEQVRALLTHQLTAGDETEPEAVHQMRVAGRRMRVALKAAGPVLGEAGERLRAELAWLGGVLGPVRDLDVLTERLAAERDSLAEADADGFAEVLTALHAARTLGRHELIGALAGRRYRTLLRALATQALIVAETGEPAAGTEAVALVRRPGRKLRQEVSAAGKHPADAELHELRIRGKRVRYAADFAIDLAGKRDAPRLRAVSKAAKGFQEKLGTHQDTVVAEERLRTLLAEAALSAPAALVLGRLVERQTALRDHCRATWRDSWRDLDHAIRALTP